MLRAVAPQVGGPRVIAAAPEMMIAMGLAIDEETVGVAMPLLRRRRPLLRAAAVGGGAYAFGKHRERKQEYEQQQAYEAGQGSVAQAPPPTRRGLTAEDTQRLGELGKLHEQGVITDDEFATQKSKYSQSELIRASRRGWD